jgi:hypothetical protein
MTRQTRQSLRLCSDYSDSLQSDTLLFCNVNFGDSPAEKWQKAEVV